MAELTGLSQAFLSMLESGARRLTNIDKIVELLLGLNTPVELTGPMLRIANWMDDPEDGVACANDRILKGHSPVASTSPTGTGEN